MSLEGCVIVGDYEITARRVDAQGSVAECKNARIVLDTAAGVRSDAFDPVELLLASLAACILKGIERTAPLMQFRMRGAQVRVHGERSERSPRLLAIHYELVVDTDESDQRLDLLHRNVHKFGTVTTTLAELTRLQGRAVRGHLGAVSAPGPDSGADPTPPQRG